MIMQNKLQYSYKRKGTIPTVGSSNVVIKFIQSKSFDSGEDIKNKIQIYEAYNIKNFYCYRNNWSAEHGDTMDKIRTWKKGEYKYYKHLPKLLLRLFASHAYSSNLIKYCQIILKVFIL